MYIGLYVFWVCIFVYACYMFGILCYVLGMKHWGSTYPIMTGLTTTWLFKIKTQLIDLIGANQKYKFNAALITVDLFFLFECWNYIEWTDAMYAFSLFAMSMNVHVSWIFNISCIWENSWMRFHYLCLLGPTRPLDSRPCDIQCRPLRLGRL